MAWRRGHRATLRVVRTSRLWLCGVALAAVLGGCATPPPQVPLPAAGSAPSAARARSPVSVAPPVVVLDPGHNGRNSRNLAAINRQVPDGRGGTKACNTTGTQTDAGYPEHAFNFDVASRVAQQLTAAGVRVVMTRTDDDGVGPCVDERGRAGDSAGAAAIVSIHADGAPARGAGFHVAYSDPPLNPAQEAPAHELSVALRDAMRSAGFVDSNYIGRDGLSPRSDLAGLNLATRPTALVECANMRNPAEAALVSSPEGRARYASALAQGVLAYLHRPG
ncbi:N-acetylmuramoyl-L-alanine amidase [Pseudonocardia xinjiangensis]|uniref:N-acetylmuramoyl-L-alanine amidase n=1 Tax=Pseudonocardia xinjiangensis TaxID=75289 RepID=A0ABX1RHM4_9PSEU|nr:N-acetylmuramoyl-L-alanine amidase [Pseudonocardia xinjiangensis]